MRVNKKTHRQARLQNYLFVVLFIGIVGSLAWLSTRYSFNADWTVTGRNSLSPASIALLENLSDTVNITCYATEVDTLRRSVSDTVKRYQRHKPDIHLQFINPDLVPDTIRELGITSNGELIIEYQGRKENLKSISEEAITNSLQRLARSGESWLVFLSGHGERKPQGGANHDLDTWAQQLQTRGFKTQSHNLAENSQLPDNTRVLVVASPQVELLAGERQLIADYIAKGGNLLWLTDPDARFGADLLKDSLGISLQDGVIVDPNTQILGISDPRFAIVVNYADHPISRDMDALTLFPQAVPLLFNSTQAWNSTNLLNTEPRSWADTGSMTGQIQFDEASDIPGPLNLGFALTRTAPSNEQSDGETPREQRVVILGDGDFLSNAFLGNGGNLKLGMNIINWLAHDDRFISIPVNISPDKNLQLSPLAQGVIGIAYLFVIPLGLATAGAIIWWRRRKR